MAHRRKFVIYLAGPISDCNEAQMKFWRNEVKSKYASKFEFRDPVDNLMDEKVAASEIIKADLEAIENADGLLVNMWRESLGSAIGIVHAHQKGRPVVVANPNHIRNHMLEFYTDIMADSPIKAAKELHDLLRAETSWQVMKSGERKEEPFNRRKLIDALRFACRDADCDDIVLPRMVLPRVIDSLTKSDRTIRRNLPTGAIDEAVKDVLLDLADEFPDAIGVARTWREHRLQKQVSLPEPAERTRTGEIDVPIASSKSHGTIWGKGIKKLDDIRSAEAREIFRKIRSVPGVTRILMGPFGRGDSRGSCSASVFSSRTPCVIEGRLYDQGVKGTVQNFQVRVQLEAEQSMIRDQIEARLKEGNVWAG